jgi:hypothetical protein
MVLQVQGLGSALLNKSAASFSIIRFLVVFICHLASPRKGWLQQERRMCVIAQVKLVEQNLQKRSVVGCA